MTNERSIILGFNFHLPLGSPDELFEKVYTTRLIPFFQILYTYPKIPIALHLSGTLLSKIERVHGEFFMMINDMVERRQIELVGGGFYEPAMPLMQNSDRIGQIELLTTYLRKLFGKKVTGCWIPPAVWEEALVNTIARSGMLYTFVDESRFTQAGLSEADFNLPCVCEDKGKTITVFPLFSHLSETIRTRGAAAALDELLAHYPDEPFVRTIFPDFFNDNEASINRFFEDITRYESNVRLSLPKYELMPDCARQRVHFPLCMDRKYLVDYPEASAICGKITRAQSLIEQLKGERERRRIAHEELWKSQDYSLFCYNDDCAPAQSGQTLCPGVYNAALRSAAFSAVLEAEYMSRKTGWLPSLLAYDLDFDGAPEYLFQEEKLNCYVRERGAALFEVDFLPARWNYQNTVTLPLAPRRESEASFFDIIAPAETQSVNELNIEYCRVAGGEVWQKTDIDRGHLRAVFNLAPRQGVFGALKLIKDCKLSGTSFNVSYTITNTGSEKMEFTFFTKVNLSFPGESEKMLRLFAYDSWKSFSNNGEKRSIALNEANITGTEAIDFQDLRNELIINISADRAFNAELSRVSIPHRTVFGEDVSVYQWTQIVPRLTLALDGGASASFLLRLSIFQ